MRLLLRLVIVKLLWIWFYRLFVLVVRLMVFGGCGVVCILWMIRVFLGVLIFGLFSEVVCSDSEGRLLEDLVSVGRVSVKVVMFR